MINKLARILELDLAAQNDDRTKADRERIIDGLGSPIKREMAKVMFLATSAKPEASRAVLGKIASKNGLEYCGAGIEYSVYHDLTTDEALKMHMESAAKSAQEKQAIAEQKDKQRALLANYLGEAVIDQSVGINEHVFGGYQTVQVRQPFVDFAPDDSPFSVQQAEIDLGNLARIVASQPDAAEGLSDFVTGSYRMLDSEQVLPDTNGQNNLLANHNGVVLIDTTPISASEGIAELVVEQLKSLELGLAEVK